MFLENCPSLWQRYFIAVWTWTHSKISQRWYRPPSPSRLLPHSQTGQQQLAASLGTVLSETVSMISLSAPSTVACSEQLVHSRTTNHNIHPMFPINNPGLDTNRYLPLPNASYCVLPVSANQSWSWCTIHRQTLVTVDSAKYLKSNHWLQVALQQSH